MDLTNQEQAFLAALLQQHGWDCRKPNVADPSADPNVDPDIVGKLRRTVDELELSVRASNCFRDQDIRYLYELITKSRTELLRGRRVGPATIKEISTALAVLGLHLGTPANDPNVLAARALWPRQR